MSHSTLNDKFDWLGRPAMHSSRTIGLHWSPYGTAEFSVAVELIICFDICRYASEKPEEQWLWLSVVGIINITIQQRASSCDTPCLERQKLFKSLTIEHTYPPKTLGCLWMYAKPFPFAGEVGYTENWNLSPNHFWRFNISGFIVKTKRPLRPIIWASSDHSVIYTSSKSRE